MRRIAAVTLLAAAVTACVTPMGAGEIQSLTTCKNTDLKKIRKSLLLNGYEIKSEGDSDLVTDWKQVGGYGRDRSLQRVTVVKVDDTTYKFNVRVRDVRIEKNDSGMAITNADKRKSSTVVLDLSQPVETTNDYDRSYYQEYRDRYSETQREVCGS